MGIVHQTQFTLLPSKCVNIVNIDNILCQKQSEWKVRFKKISQDVKNNSSSEFQRTNLSTCQVNCPGCSGLKKKCHNVGDLHRGLSVNSKCPYCQVSFV